MGYINDFRAKLRQLIEEGETEHALKYAADTVLESYRNGQNGEQRSSKAEHRDGESTRQFREPRPSPPQGSRARKNAPRSS